MKEQRFLFTGFRPWFCSEYGSFPLQDSELRFFLSSTSTPAKVYKFRNGDSSWGTSVPIDLNGYVAAKEGGSAIWLDRSKSYDVQVWQRISKDPLAEKDEYKTNPLYWRKLWSVDDVCDPSGIENSLKFTEGAFTVQNIEELKTINPYNFVGQIAEVLGYYEPGDCGSSLVFEFVHGDKNNPDDGYRIAPNDSSINGRWIQKFGGVVDVAKFGAIPNRPQIDCLGNIRNAINFCLSSSQNKRTLKFSLSGLYHLSGDLDFGASNYVDASTGEKDLLFVIVDDNVCFGGISDIVEVNFGGCYAFIRSDSPLVNSLGSLKFNDGCVSFIRPQWFYSKDKLISDCLVQAASLKNNPNKIPVKLYGSMRNHSLMFKGAVHTFYAPIYIEELNKDKYGLSQFGLANDGCELHFENTFSAPTDLFIFNTGVGLGKVFFNTNIYASSLWFGNYAEAAMQSVPKGVLDVYGFDLNGFSVNGNGCVVDIKIPIDLMNGSLQNVFVSNNDRKLLFKNVTQNAGVCNLQLNNSEAWIEWFTDSDSVDISAYLLTTRKLKSKKSFTGIQIYPYSDCILDGVECGSLLISSSDDSSPGLTLKGCSIRTFNQNALNLSLLLEDCSVNGIATIQGKMIKISNCSFLNGYEINLLPSSVLWLVNNIFYGSVIVSSYRSVNGFITKNLFTKEVAPTEPYALQYKVFPTETITIPSQIEVMGNKFLHGYEVVSSLQNAFVELTITEIANDVVYADFVNPIRLFDKDANYSVHGKGVYESGTSGWMVECDFSVRDGKSVSLHLGGNSDNKVHGCITRVGDLTSFSNLSGLTKILTNCSFTNPRSESRWS